MSADHAARPRRRRPTATILVAIVVLAGAGWWLSTNRPWEPRPFAVPVETATAGAASRVLAVNGRISPQSQVAISSTVSGRVLAVHASEGDMVKQRRPLVSINSTQQRAAVDQAKATLEAARAQLSQAKVDYERAEALGDNISRRDLDAKKLALQTAQDEVNRLLAATAQAESLLSQYQISAPFDGMVLVRAVDPGQVVSPSSVLLEFVGVTHLQAEASVDELYSADIRRGLAAQLKPSGHNVILHGTVEFVAPNVETSTGGRLVRVAIGDSKDVTLPIGLTVNVNIIVEQRDSAITVPRSAIVTEDLVSFVYVIDGDRAVRRPVEYVDWPASRLIVTSGLTDGDSVIADPAGVSEGALVSPQGD